MIFENFIKDSLKPIEGLLTKQRFCLFAASFLLVSPDFFSLFTIIYTNPNISTLWGELKKFISTAPAVNTIVLASINFYFSPLLFQLIVNLSNKIQIRKFAKSTKSLLMLSEKKENFFIEKTEEIEMEWKEEKERAEKTIKARANYGEFLISTTFLCLAMTLQYETDILPIVLLIFVCILYCVDASNKTLKDYLIHIAPYKIAENKFLVLRLKKAQTK